MANPTSKLDLVVNGVTTSYDIHDANAVPRSGGAVISGGSLSRTVDNGELRLDGGTGWNKGASLSLSGKDRTNVNGNILLHTTDGTNTSELIFAPNGTTILNTNGAIKTIALYEDVVPRSGGAVMTGSTLSRNVDNDGLIIRGGAGYETGAQINLYGANRPSEKGFVFVQPNNSVDSKSMIFAPDGTWTWNGTAVQITSDQRYKQQIDQIDDKLLDAWEDVTLVQFKYNDAVDQKGKDKARLHTGYVVQQIQKACEEHGVDISQYGLFCHEEYAEETEEVEVENEDGTKTKERKVVREASEHYSLRYTEALIVECKYLRRCIARLTARIEQLEKEPEASK